MEGGKKSALVHHYKNTHKQKKIHSEFFSSIPKKIP